MPDTEATYEREFIQLLKQAGFLRNLSTWIALVSGRLNVLKNKSFAEGNPPWRILRYQHVVHPELAKYPILNTEFVRPQTFAAQMRYLKNETNIVSLNQLTKSLRENQTIEPGTIALTFDGGYLDHYEEAAPILEKYSLPATIFMPSAFIGTMYQPWQKLLISSLQLLRDEGFPFPIIEGYFEEEFISKLETASPDYSINESVILLIVDYLKAQSLEKRALGLKVFEDLTARDIGGLPEAKVFMSWENAKELKNINIDFAPLGHSMVPFNQLGAEFLKEEIKNALVGFKEQNLEPLAIFALPEGEMGPEVMQELENLDIKLALGLGVYDIPKTFDKASILGRVNIYQQASDTVGAFAARVWNLNLRKYFY